jgi:hypothetical protein
MTRRHGSDNEFKSKPMQYSCKHGKSYRLAARHGIIYVDALLQLLMTPLHLLLKLLHFHRYTRSPWQA